MFSKPHVISALEAKRDLFAAHERRTGEELDRYRQALDTVAAMSRAELEERLAAIPRPGARPTAERVAGRPLVLPFNRQWANHQDARAWALEVLSGVTTVAVDGSQITPQREYGIPVGAVQVGWFENPHVPDGRYVKDLCFEALAPDELAAEDDAGSSFPNLRVNLRRFELECETLAARMGRLRGDAPRALCFFDGSLVISFAAQMRPEYRHAYVRAIRGLLDASEATRVPLVGYIDTSYATDLVSMLRWAARDAGMSETPHISDGALLRDRMAWGDRTEALECARDDALSTTSLFEHGDEVQGYYHRVHVVYLKTTAANAPARLDVPAWLLEEGRLDWAVDVVRAECVVGTGYPYAIETADAVAVITAQDRERFYRTFQEFTATLGIPLRYARKAYSKRQRR
jgi:hypothetical protein